MGTDSGPSASLPDQMAQATSDLIEAASVRRAFGEPIIQGERTLIPMASVTATVGFGGGSGSGPAGEGGGSGSGGGGRARATPVGVIALDTDGVHVHFSPNVIARLVTTIALVIAWNAFWALYTIRRGRQQQAGVGPTA